MTNLFLFRLEVLWFCILTNHCAWTQSKRSTANPLKVLTFCEMNKKKSLLHLIIISQFNPSMVRNYENQKLLRKYSNRYFSCEIALAYEFTGTRLIERFIVTFRRRYFGIANSWWVGRARLCTSKSRCRLIELVFSVKCGFYSYKFKFRYSFLDDISLQPKFDEMPNVDPKTERIETKSHKAKFRKLRLRPIRKNSQFWIFNSLEFARIFYSMFQSLQCNCNSKIHRPRKRNEKLTEVR